MRLAVLSTLAVFCLGPALCKAEEPSLATKAHALLKNRCVQCHGGKEINGGLRFDRREDYLNGGDSGLVVDAELVENSLLLRRVLSAVPEERMPPEGDPLTESEAGLLRDWIRKGSPWPDVTPSESHPAEEMWWASQPLKPVSVPKSVSGDDRNPIDAFIRAGLVARGLSESPPADRRTLIRRITVDLTGLLPTPEETADFVADPSPLAYENLVDRLLASPAYGERWARHWLDVVHFAETHGHDQDRPRDHAWPFRDYVIESLNADKPYARFAAEQIAADSLHPEEPSLVRALGFLSAGPWDESSLRDIREDTLDRQIARYLDRDDIVTNVMSTFTSTTAHCARCHHHKFDPITQEDYYSLQAVFAGTEKGTRTFDHDPLTADRRKELARLELSLKEGAFSLAPALSPAMLAWEASLKANPPVWTVLSSSSARSEQGTTIEPLADGSYLARGTSPDVDTYTITVAMPASRITALRLEVLPDDSLPHRGPGRQDNGNLHLSEVRVSIVPKGGGEERPVTLKNAKADFDQDAWDITRSIDGDSRTAWGIYPQVGQPHAAVFECGEVPVADGDWKIVLDQQHGGRHTIGRFRLSCTSAQHPSLMAAVSTASLDSLHKPQDQRTPEEQHALERAFLQDYLREQQALLPAQAQVFAGSGEFVADGSHRPSPQPRMVHLLQRGEITRPLREMVPGALTTLTALQARFETPVGAGEAERRAALARWLTHHDNPLFWRSIVNRVWHYHFGRGLVDTPNDFGRMGGAPSHPELLDWLAVRFRDGGGSLKSLHREIVTSRTYRQTVRDYIRAAGIDADNRLLWRMNRVRLDAEVVRDSLLQIGGRLDRRMGGPSDRQFVMSPGIHVTPKVDYAAFLPDDPANTRRSVYRFLFRTLPDPLMEMLDCPAGDQLTPVRTESITSLQAFALLNNPFVVRQCEHIAARLVPERTTPDEQMQEAFRLILLRAASPDELAEFRTYAARHGLANLCRVLINSNEFLYVD